MEQVDGSTEGTGTGATGATASGGTDSQPGSATAMPMTYANLETLSRLNTDDLTSILSSTGQHRHEEDAHYADATANGGPEGDESSGYIVSAPAEYHQGTYVVTPSAAEEPANDGVDDSTTDNEASAMESNQLSVHSYCKPSAAENAGRAEGSRTTAAELLDLKTVLPGPTTRRVLLIDDGHGDLEMAKSDVEFLLRGDAAGIVLREGKRSEVWARFGKVTFQGRKVKGFVACIFCRQVYAFGDAHSTGTSTLKKHRCLAHSLVTTTGASPMTPTGAEGSVRLLPSPAPSNTLQSADQQQQQSTYVNFPSPSVIVSIATAVRNNSTVSESALAPSPPAIATRYLGPADRDELIRNAGVVLGSGPVPASSFLQLANALVQLGAKHGAGVVEDLGLIFHSPSFEAVLPNVCQGYRSHFVEEARASSGIGLVISIRSGSPLNVTLGMSYCVDGPDNTFLRHVPLRHIQLASDEEAAGRIAQLVQSTLKEERLDSLRRSIVCSSVEVLNQVFIGQMAVPCVKSLMQRLFLSAHSACPSTEWTAFYCAVQRIANFVQSIGWESLASKPVRPVELQVSALDWMELIINISSQTGELCKAISAHDPAIWNQLNRPLLGHVAAFLSAVVGVASKLGGSGPTLCNVLLARSHLVSLCTPKSSDPAALSALKHNVLESMGKEWPLEMVHRLACVLHPAFKQMRRLDMSDRERMETYAMIRNLLRQDLQSQSISDHILRNTLESSNKNGELKRKGSRTSSMESGSKRLRTSGSMPVTVAPAANNDPDTFDFSDLADFRLTPESGSGINGSLVPERDELDLYLEEKVIQQDLMELANILVYWKRRQNVFPGLSQLAFWLLSLPASTADPSESSEVARPDSVLQRLLCHVVAQSSSPASSTVVD